MKEFLTFWRYQNKAGKLYKWLLLVVLTSFSLVCSYIRVFFNDYYVGLCAKDMLLFFSRDGLVLVLAGGISTIRGLMFTYVDDNPNIIVRYNSKLKVFAYQSLSLLIIALIDMVVLYAVGIISSYVILGVYDNWQVDGSYFFNKVTRKGLSTDIGVNDVVICSMFVLRKTVIGWFAGMVSLIIEYITDWIRVAVFSAAFIYGVSLVSHISICKFDLNILDLYKYPFLPSGSFGYCPGTSMPLYNIPLTVAHPKGGILANLILLAVGLALSRRRQYYR